MKSIFLRKILSNIREGLRLLVKVFGTIFAI